MKILSNHASPLDLLSKNCALFVSLAGSGAVQRGRFERTYLWVIKEAKTEGHWQ
jgi:hypothetical protein